MVSFRDNRMEEHEYFSSVKYVKIKMSHNVFLIIKRPEGIKLFSYIMMVCLTMNISIHTSLLWFICNFLMYCICNQKFGLDSPFNIEAALFVSL